MSKENLKVTTLRDTNTNLAAFQKLEPREARVLAHQRGVTQHRTVLFESTDSTDFTILYEVIKYGVSSNLKKYRRVKVERRISCKNKKVYMYDNTTSNKVLIRQATVQMFHQNDITGVDFRGPNGETRLSEQDILYSKFPFLKFLPENDLHIAINTVFKKELFTLKKAISHYFGVQYTDNLKALLTSGYLSARPVKVQKAIFKNCINLHRVDPELFRNMDYMCDASNMAQALCKKIDLTWSYRRLQEEHDEWSKEINNIVLGADDRPLKIQEIYKRFGIFIRVEPISTTRELSLEGIKQSHCVGGYADQVDNGSCAIFHYKGYTLQVKHCDLFNDDHFIGTLAEGYNRQAQVKIAEGLKKVQFLGYKNRQPDKELTAEIDFLIFKFNQHEKEQTNENYRQLRAEIAGNGNRQIAIMANNEWDGYNRVHQERGNGVANFYGDDHPF